MDTIKSIVFKDMWEVRRSDGRLVGIGKTYYLAEVDADTFNEDTLDSNNMRDMLDTWELNFYEE